LAILVILVLAILWGAVLIPPILRSRSESGGPSGVGDFLGKLREGLGRGRMADPGLPPLQPIMGPVGGVPAPGRVTPGSPVRVPGGMTPQQRRRRDVLVALLAAVGLTFLMFVMSSSIAFLVLFLMALGLLGGYVYLLLQLKARNAHVERLRAPRRGVPVPAPAPVGPGLPNVHDLTARRFPPARRVSHVDAPREATVLALRRSASW
jgi:hypothetical protein